MLIIASVFMLFAIVAYLVGDAESNNQRHEAILREQDILRGQNEQSIADRAALHEQTERFAANRTELCRQKKVTVELQRRLDELTAEVATQRSPIARTAIALGKNRLNRSSNDQDRESEALSERESAARTVPRSSGNWLLVCHGSRTDWPLTTRLEVLFP